jgi:hypothetical protein
MRITHAIGVSIVALGVTPLLAVGQSSHFFALHRFDEQVAAYMAVRHHVEQRLPPPTVTANATNIVEAQSVLAHELRKARPRAQAGDFFSPDISSEFRRRIHRVLDQRGVSENGLAADLQRESPESLCTLSVNGNFDWRFGSMMPTVVLEALPDVPWPLQYRFVCRDLVLLDVDAGLIVDILPDALTTR